MMNVFFGIKTFIRPSIFTALLCTQSPLSMALLRKCFCLARSETRNQLLALESGPTMIQHQSTIIEDQIYYLLHKR